MDPEGLPKVDVTRQVSVATGSKTVFVAGQVEQCYLNVATALARVGGSFDDVAKLTIYAVDWTPDKYPLVLEGIARASAKLGVTPVPPVTLLGISAGFTPDLLVEVEATAVID